jgi:hypothetical protein
VFDDCLSRNNLMHWEAPRAGPSSSATYGAIQRVETPTRKQAATVLVRSTHSELTLADSDVVVAELGQRPDAYNAIVRPMRGFIPVLHISP